MKLRSTHDGVVVIDGSDVVLLVKGDAPIFSYDPDTADCPTIRCHDFTAIGMYGAPWWWRVKTACRLFVWALRGFRWDLEPKWLP